MKRRKFIKSILATSTILLGGVAAFQWSLQANLEYLDEIETDFLTADDQLLLNVLIPVMLAGNGVSPDLKTSIGNIDQVIIRLPMRTQIELRELFDLLTSALGRLVLAGIWLNWQQTDSNKISKFLTEWRESSLSLLQQAYVGLHQLIIGSVYAEPQHWPAIGYPGPPNINRLN